MPSGSGSSPIRGKLPKPTSKNKTLPVLLFQARTQKPIDKYGMFWTDGKEGDAVAACCPEGEYLPGERFTWESTGRGAACPLSEAIERAKDIAAQDGRQYRLVSINYVDEVGMKYIVEWIG